MTILLIIFLIYIIGCVLAFGRSYAEGDSRIGLAFITLISWVGFFVLMSEWLEDERGRKFIAYPSRPKILPEYDFENRVPEMYSWR